MRAHLYKPITEVHGNIQFGTVVRILQPDAAPDSVAPITDPVFKYKSEIDYTELGTTFTVTNGVVDCWLDDPQYVMLGLTPPGQPEYFIDNVAVLSPLPRVIGEAIFSFSGAPTAGHVSAPYRVLTSLNLKQVVVSLGTAGSTASTVQVYVNAVSAATVTIGSTVTSVDLAVNIPVTTGDLVTVAATTVGTGALDFTTQVSW